MPLDKASYGARNCWEIRGDLGGFSQGGPHPSDLSTPCDDPDPAQFDQDPRRDTYVCSLGQPRRLVSGTPWGSSAPVRKTTGQCATATGTGTRKTQDQGIIRATRRWLIRQGSSAPVQCMAFTGSINPSLSQELMSRLETDPPHPYMQKGCCQYG